MVTTTLNAQIETGIGYEVRVFGRTRELVERLTELEDVTVITWYIYVARSEYAESWYAMEKRADLDLFELLVEIPKVGPSTAAKLMDSIPDAFEFMRLIANCSDKELKRRGITPTKIRSLSDDKIVARAERLLERYTTDDTQGAGDTALRKRLEQLLESMGFTALEVSTRLGACDLSAYTDFNVALRAVLQGMGPS
jgi:Holliday junction resolvasome RuvABC DNA-binding subunit